MVVTYPRNSTENRSTTDADEVVDRRVDSLVKEMKDFLGSPAEMMLASIRSSSLNDNS